MEWKENYVSYFKRYKAQTVYPGIRALALKEILDKGNHRGVMEAFNWGMTPQDAAWWQSYYRGERQLTGEDHLFLSVLYELVVNYRSVEEAVDVVNKMSSLSEEDLWV